MRKGGFLVLEHVRGGRTRFSLVMVEMMAEHWVKALYLLRRLG